MSTMLKTSPDYVQSRWGATAEWAQSVAPYLLGTTALCATTALLPSTVVQQIASSFPSVVTEGVSAVSSYLPSATTAAGVSLAGYLSCSALNSVCSARMSNIYASAAAEVAEGIRVQEEAQRKEQDDKDAAWLAETRKGQKDAKRARDTQALKARTSYRAPKPTRSPWDPPQWREGSEGTAAATASHPVAETADSLDKTEVDSEKGWRAESWPSRVVW